MIAVHNIVAGTEQQEHGTLSTVYAFGLALSDALVTDERTLLMLTRPSRSTPLSRPYVRLPKMSLVEMRQGRADSFMPKKYRRTGSHLSVRMVSKSVRDALVTFGGVLTTAHATKFCLDS